MPFVLDNSVVCGWLFENQSTAYTNAIASHLGDDGALVPALLHLEYTNVLRTACKRGILTAQRAQQVIRELQKLPIETDRTTPDPAQLLALALRFNLTAYDATYLELALRRQLPLATVDAALAEAAQTAGVGVLLP